ncbi:MAG: peptidyl-prolyl cis-trans isomerase [Candidatus Omnitrophota bacterium]
MKKQGMVLLLAVSLVLCSGCGDKKGADLFKFGRRAEEKKVPQAQQVEGTVLASVEGRVITMEDFNSRIEAFNKEVQASTQIPEAVKDTYLIKKIEDKQNLLQRMIERELLISEAMDRGLDKDKEVQQAIKALEEQLLFAKLVDSERAKVNVTTEEVQNYYNLYKDAFAVPEERRVSMIVVSGEDKAKEILIQLLQGADFGTLARDNSTDNSASSGGDIGSIVQTLPFPQQDKKTMFKQFEEMAFSLELNKPSAIFQGTEGFYLIKVTEIKEARERQLSEVYKDIEQGLLLKKQEDTLNALIGNLRKSGNIIVHEELLRK